MNAIARLICRLRGHDTPGVTLGSGVHRFGDRTECRRCGGRWVFRSNAHGNNPGWERVA